MKHYNYFIFKSKQEQSKVKREIHYYVHSQINIGSTPGSIISLWTPFFMSHTTITAKLYTKSKQTTAHYKPMTICRKCYKQKINKKQNSPHKWIKAKIR